MWLFQMAGAAGEKELSPPGVREMSWGPGTDWVSVVGRRESMEGC